jgi:ATP-dependent DNA helicase RecG
VLSTLYHERRIDTDTAGVLIQKGAAQARAVLAGLHEKDFIEARGEKKGRAYHLSASMVIVAASDKTYSYFYK